MIRRPLGLDVYDAAMQRLMESYSDPKNFVVVSVSGGKDSGVCLEMAVEVARSCGRLPVNAVIQDEEIAYPGTYEYVERLAMRTDEINLRWINAKQPCMNVCDRVSPYFWVFDDALTPDQWVRQPPKHLAGYREIDVKNIEAIVSPVTWPEASGHTIIDVVGLRVQESAKRLLGLVSSGGHLTGSEKRYGVLYRRLRPIYDWTDGDIWRAIRDNKWDYNRAYDTFNRMGVPRGQLRIGPPTLNQQSITQMGLAAKAWPQWFERVSRRLRGVRSVASFGPKILRPNRRVTETWEECFKRECIEKAPAAWIAERATYAMEYFLRKHAQHSSQPFPEVKSCLACGGAGLSCWRSLAMGFWNGDPFSLKGGPIGMPYLEPEFFRPGAGKWDGKPSW